MSVKALGGTAKGRKGSFDTGLNPMARRSVQGHTDYSIAA